jgi:hypothetical protein
MRLTYGWHLAYCTNIHRGETWAEIFAALKTHTLAVRDRVSPGQSYAIGLRLGDQAARALSEPFNLREFQRWLERENCYVFTVNGFPYGRFHGTRVKEQVYLPDWSMPERLEYTNRLFDLVAQIVPAGVEGSVSTLPVSFKEFATDQPRLAAARANLWQCIAHIEQTSRRSGKTLHLGLEPEPLCCLETTEETVRFFEAMRQDRPGDDRVNSFLGVNYDCCHLAVEFEEAQTALARLAAAGIKISKAHLSNALRVRPSLEAREALRAFADGVYLHQVVAQSQDGQLTRYKDLPLALERASAGDREWRVHFHVPLHSKPTGLFGSTADHLHGVLDYLAEHPRTCGHFEMETYTWEVLPPGLKSSDVTGQLALEYQWVFEQFARRGIKSAKSDLLAKRAAM